MPSGLILRLSRCLVLVGMPVGGLLAALMAGPASGAVAAVFPPWWSATQTIIAASTGGPILRIGLADFVVIVTPGDGPARARLWQAGAWFLLNPHGLAGCGTRSGNVTNGK